MKLFNMLAWASGVLAVAIMVFGVIALFMGNNPFGIRREANYFIVANSFLLLAILGVLAGQGCRERKD